MNIQKRTIGAVLGIILVVGLVLGLSAAPAWSSGETVHLDVGVFNPGEALTITFDVTVDTPFPSGVTQVTNTGTVSGDNFTPDVDTNAEVTDILLPEMDVSGGGNAIADGDATPSTTDDTDFGNIAVAGGTNANTFTITNSGTAALNLTADSPHVTIGGTHAADFTLTTVPTTPLSSGGGTTTFEITFDPSAPGLREATVSIANDDADENPYDFDIQGNGLVPDMVVSGNGSDIANGDPSPSAVDGTDLGAADTAVGSVTNTFTITNNGPVSLNLSGTSPYVSLSGTHAADFTVTAAPSSTVASGGGTTTFDITFDPSGPGAHTATVSVSSDDLDDTPYTFAIQGTGGSYPEISVEGNSVEIADGDGTPSTADGTDFGYDLFLYAAYSPEHEFTISNTGSAALNLTDTPRVTLTGTDFTLTQDAPASIAPGGTGTFKIRFAATATVVRTGTVSIANDDNGETPYSFAIRGEGYSGALMIVEGGSPQQDIEDGDTTPSADDDTDFGTTNVAGGTVEHTFQIENSGSSDLTLGGTPRVDIIGGDTGDFSVTLQPGTTIETGDSDLFRIRFDPNASGLRSATVSIDNNDPNRNPYTFAIQGTGQSVTTVTTQAVTDETSHSATGNGTITDLGLPNPTAHGVVWNMAGGPDPTLADNSTDEGALGAVTLPYAFTSTMNGLDPNTSYAVRAYATNDIDTAYGDVVTFTTLPSGMPPVYYLLDEPEPERRRR
ncbi:MAG: choice-of-anchor D domain-containing protein [Thermodesulfobacteriota bacterium]|nr:choice-of-anchor D domain-containing protein [Thermodesulfobacteriota bacterium]